MKTRLSLIALLSFLGALCAWSGVAFFALSIQNMTARAVQIQGSVHAANTKQTTALKTRLLAKDIAPERAQLETFFKTDPLFLASLIKQAGKDAGVVVEVQNASLEGVPSSASASSKTPRASTVSFALESTADFADLINTVAFLEALPMPSSVQDIDIKRVSDSRETQWRMGVHMRVLTASQISS